MPHVDNHQVESPETSVTSRRRLLSALVAGGAFATAAPLLAGRASAAEGGSSFPTRDPQDNNALNNAHTASPLPRFLQTTKLLA